MTRVALCLSGCGVFDGSEIHESVLTLLALDRAGARIVRCAPNVDQTVVDEKNRIVTTPAYSWPRGRLDGLNPPRRFEFLFFCPILHKPPGTILRKHSKAK